MVGKGKIPTIWSFQESESDDVWVVQRLGLWFAPHGHFCDREYIRLPGHVLAIVWRPGNGLLLFWRLRIGLVVVLIH